MKCGKCGEDILKEFNFCHRCGKQVQLLEQVVEASTKETPENSDKKPQTFEQFRKCRAANYCRTSDNVRPNLANVRTKPNFDRT